MSKGQIRELEERIEIDFNTIKRLQEKSDIYDKIFPNGNYKEVDKVIESIFNDNQKLKSILDEIKDVVDFDNELELSGHIFKKKLKEILAKLEDKK